MIRRILAGAALVGCVLTGTAGVASADSSQPQPGNPVSALLQSVSDLVNGLLNGVLNGLPTDQLGGVTGSVGGVTDSLR
jgi:hypothetical protein